MEPKHDDSGAQKEAPKFYLYENKFKVPHVGTFELHLKEPNPYVELFRPSHNDRMDLNESPT
jgi:hypothetical protein